MRVVQRPRGLLRDPDGLLDRELPVAPKPAAQALALDVGHREPQPAGGVARVVDRQEVGMLEPGGEPDLPEEALGAERRRQLGMEHLERDRPLVPQVLDEVHRAHAAAPELAFEPVAVAQGVGERGRRDGHLGSDRGMTESAEVRSGTPVALTTRAAARPGRPAVLCTHGRRRSIVRGGIHRIGIWHRSRRRYRHRVRRRVRQRRAWRRDRRRPWEHIRYRLRLRTVVQEPVVARALFAEIAASTTWPASVDFSDLDGNRVTAHVKRPHHSGRSRRGGIRS